MDNCCDPTPAKPTKASSCTPSVVETPIWYLSDSGCPEKGTEVATKTCNPTRVVLTYKDADGAPLVDPKLITVSYSVVASCEKPTPPADITLDGQDCEGVANPQTGKPGELVNVVQAPGQVFTVRLCVPEKDIEKVVMCDVLTGDKVAVISDLTDPANPVVTLWNISTGSPYVGTVEGLEQCPGTVTESDPEVMCDNGTTFWRWFIKENGKPNGEYYDTTLTNQIYTVVDEAAVSPGKCEAGIVQENSWALGGDLSTLKRGTSFSINKSHCCSLLIQTSVGPLFLPIGVENYSTQIYKAPITIDSLTVVDGTCDLNTVTINSNLSY